MEALAPRPRTGLVIGKFMPPHAGHLHLLREAAARVERLTVLVCSLAHEPIPGRVRHAWVRELVPEARVAHVTDELPSYPHEHPRFWELWTAVVRREMPEGPEVVFAGEAYGEELARRLGARFELVDRALEPVLVSGTAVRERPLEHWALIPAPVRPYFVRRVVVTGSESTGKTTLAARLAAHYGTVWTPEFARGYLNAKPEPLDRADIEPIARGQVAMEDEAARRAERVLIQDTDLLSTAVYAGHYYGEAPAWIGEALRARRPHLYLLLAPDVPWVPDPQRDRGHLRAEMHALFAGAVRATGAPFVEIEGAWDERFRRSVAAIDALLAGGDPEIEPRHAAGSH